MACIITPSPCECCGRHTKSVGALAYFQGITICEPCYLVVPKPIRDAIDVDIAQFADPNRHLIAVPDTFAIARWPRHADVATIARCILGTLKYEPHTADTTPLRQALEDVIEQRARGVPAA